MSKPITFNYDDYLLLCKECEKQKQQTEADKRQIAELNATLHMCVNELCLRCGDYKRAHLGACDGCIWEACK